MPQALTYAELGELTGRTAEAARNGVVAGQWSRRRCSDGLTRVKLPPALAHEFMCSYAELARTRVPPMDLLADLMVAGLRGMAGEPAV
jgi:hypothetical protein